MEAPLIPEWLRERNSYPSMHILSTPQPLFTLNKREKRVEEKRRKLKEMRAGLNYAQWGYLFSFFLTR